MDPLEASKEAIEKALYFRLADLLNLDVELIFYDTTSVHFESDEGDEGSGEGDEVGGSVCSGAKTYRAPRKRGKSKDGRDDAPQIVVGLAVTRDGFPVRHWVFPGNTVDVTTVAKVQAELKDWRLGRWVFVGDAGMVSEKNLKALSASGGRYIVGMPIHLGGEVDQAVLSRPGRYQEVAENLRVKEVVVGEGERRRRYIVCHNPQEEARQRAHRERVLATLEAELESLRHHAGEAHSKRLCALPQAHPHRPAPHRPGPSQGRRALGRQVRRAQQRRHPQRRGHGAGLQAAAAGGGGLAYAQERPASMPDLPLGSPSDPDPRRAQRARPLTRAHGRARLRRHLA